MCIGEGMSRRKKSLYIKLIFVQYYLESTLAYPRSYGPRGSPIKHLLEMKKLNLESLNDTIFFPG